MVSGLGCYGSGSGYKSSEGTILSSPVMLFTSCTNLYRNWVSFKVSYSIVDCLTVLNTFWFNPLACAFSRSRLLVASNEHVIQHMHLRYSSA